MLFDSAQNDIDWDSLMSNNVSLSISNGLSTGNIKGLEIKKSPVQLLRRKEPKEVEMLLLIAFCQDPFFVVCDLHELEKKMIY